MPKAMLVDMSKCMGCRACQVACKQWNGNEAVETTNEGSYENPPELSASTWTRIEFREDYESWAFRKHNCMHCTDASCEAVCPTGAISHNGEFVIVDQEQCIGCGYCSMACPFSAIHRAPPRGTARKCTFCIDRVTNGYEPACAKVCPPGAIQFGERGDLIVLGRQRVEYLNADGYPNAQLYGENEVGGTHNLFVLTDRPSALGLPEAPRVATSTVLAQWLSGFITAGVLAALPFWLLFRRKKELQEEKSQVGGRK